MLINSKTLVRGLTALVLAGAAVTAVQNPAAAFPLKQYVSASSLKAHCDAAGGSFAQNGSRSACATDKGDVWCDSKKHQCYGATSAADHRSDGLPADCQSGSSASIASIVPGASVGSSSFLARVAESVGWSSPRAATTGASQAVSVASDAASVAHQAGTVARQGERGVQELEHLASGSSQSSRGLASVSHAGETAAAREKRRTMGSMLR